MAASRKQGGKGPRSGRSANSKSGKSFRRSALGFESLELRRMMALVVPGYDSLPGAAQSLYIDFDGSAAFDWLGANPARHAHGPGGDDAPIHAFSLDGDFNDFSDEELTAIQQVWSDVAEKFSPFNINVTTVPPAALNDYESIQMIVGGDQLWMTLNPNTIGGSLFEGYTDIGVSNQGFAFSENIIAAGSVTLSEVDRELLSETIAHEAGHIFGLAHQSTVDSDNNVLEVYSDGNALGVPIMGDSGTLENIAKHGIWFSGASSSGSGKKAVYAGQQDDLDHLYNLLGAAPDDHGLTSNWTTNDNQGHFTAKGIIGNLVDTDGFRFTATGTYGYFAMNNQGPLGMLTPRMELRSWPDNTPVAPLETTTLDSNFIMHFDNLVIGQEYVVVASSDFAYGSLGHYEIFGSNFYSFAYVENRVLHVNGSDDVDDDIQLDLLLLDQYYYYVDNVVNGNVVTLLVPVSDVDAIVVNTGSGNDSLRYRSPLGPAISTVDMGAGLDVLEVRGGIGADTFMINGYNVNVSGTQVNFTDSVELLIAQGLGGDDVFNVLTSSSTGLLLYGGEDNDTATFGSTVLGSNGAGGDLFFGGNGVDTLGFVATAAADHAFTVGSSPYYEGAVSASIDGVGRSVGHSEVETIRLDGGVLADQFNINYLPKGRTVIANGNEGADTFAIGKNLPGALLSNGNNGNDSFIVGGGNVGTAYSTGTITGGAGNDSIVFDDSQYAGAANWAITDTNVQRNIPGRAQVFSYAGFEGVGIKTGTGGATANNITTFGAIPVSVTVTGGAGRDNFFINNFANEAAGGAFGPEQLQSMFDGGGGFNQLTVDDTARGALTYNLFPDRLQINESLADDGDFRFAGISAMGVTASDSRTTLNVYGTPTSIVPGNQTTFMLHGGNDVANVYPRDAAGNLTITTNLGIIGEGGTDTVTIQDGASADALHYLVSNVNGAGTQSIFGMGLGGFGSATVENLVINAGAGADVFDVNQYASGTSLVINAGAGDDLLNLGNGNLQANITSIAALTFNGQADNDAIELKNAASTAAFTYRRNIGTLGFANGAYTFNVNESSTERVLIEAGSGADVFRITGVAADTALDIAAGAGIDVLLLGDLSFNVSSIAGPINFDSQADAGRVQVSDTNSTIGKIAHLGLDSLGAAPGDTLFGPGGSLHFTTLANQVSGITFDAMSLLLGSGADTVYAQPFATGTVNIEGRNPTTTLGDELYLALATAENFVQTGSPSSGYVTSDNLKKLTYFGFEATSVLDETPPPVDVPVDALPADFDGDRVVDGFDFLAWQLGVGAPDAVNADGDADGDADVDGDDLAVWGVQFGIEEAAGANMAAPAAFAVAASVVAPETVLSSDLVDLAMASDFGLSARSLSQQPSRVQVRSERRPDFAPLSRQNLKSLNTTGESKGEDQGTVKLASQLRRDPLHGGEIALQESGASAADLAALDRLFAGGF